MYALSTQLKRLPILSLQTGQTIAFTDQPIINPDNLEVVAFSLETNRWHKQVAVVLTQSIRRISQHGIVVDSADDIDQAEDIVRLKQVMDKRFNLGGIAVNSESGVKLGRVDDFTVNLETFQIQKIYVRQSLLRNVLLNNLLIDRAQIIEVSSRRILVRDTSIKKPLLSARPLVPE